MMDIETITNCGGPEGWAGDVIHLEKLENHKNSSCTKIKYYITFIFFSMIDIYSIFYIWEAEAQAGGIGSFICTEILENHKNSIHTKIKFDIIFFL